MRLSPSLCGRYGRRVFLQRSCLCMVGGAKVAGLAKLPFQPVTTSFLSLQYSFSQFNFFGVSIY